MESEENESRKRLEDFIDGLDTSAPVDTATLKAILEIDDRFEKLFPIIIHALVEVIDRSREQKASSVIIDALTFLKRNSFRCRQDSSKYFVTACLLAHAYKHVEGGDRIFELADSVLTSIRPSIYSDKHNVLPTIVDHIKLRVQPRMKALADKKEYTSSLSIWRAFVKFTRLEKIPTTLTNKILQIATMAFKETRTEVHVEAFKSWRTLIESLPHATLRKTNYIALLLNPLNRVHRDTDSAIATHKYAAWWQLVLSLRDDIHSHFDDVISNMLSKVFNLPSAKARQTNPTAFMNPTREVAPEAYTILALVIGDAEGCKRLPSSMRNLTISSVCQRDENVAKHLTLFEEIFAIVKSNSIENVTPPSKEYLVVLCRMVLRRAGALFEEGHFDMVRCCLSFVTEILQQGTLTPDQCLSLLTDASSMSPKLTSLSISSSSSRESLAITLTTILVEKVRCAMTEVSEDSKRKYRTILRSLLGGASSMDAGAYLDVIHGIVGSMEVSQIHVLQEQTWLELSDRVIERIKADHKVNQGGNLFCDFGAIISLLAFPHRREFNFTSDTYKKWNELFVVFAIHAALLKDLPVNKHIEQISSNLLALFGEVEFDLNRLLLISQCIDVISKHCSYEGTAPNTDSLIDCVEFLLRKGIEEFVDNQRQLKSNCQFFVNIADTVTLLVQRISNDPTHRVLRKLSPFMISIISKTKNKASLKDNALHNVELPLCTALGHFAEAFASQLADSKDTDLLKLVNEMMQESSSHWKASIRDPLKAMAKAMSIEVTDVEQSTQSLSQFMDIPDVKPIHTMQTKSPSSSSGPSSKKKSVRRSRRDEEEEEFTPIKTSKKKVILTEHQLDKQTESKILPSLYADLSQSVDKNYNEEKITSVIVNKINAPVIEEDAVFRDITPKKEEAILKVVEVKTPEANEEKKQPKARRSLAGKEAANDVSLACDTAKPNVGDTVDDEENEEPLSKKKKRFSYNENDDDCLRPVQQDQPSSVKLMAERLQERVQDDREDGESPMRAQGARKRKLGQIVESPVAAKLQQRNFILNSPSSRSKRMLEAVQARNPIDFRHSMAGFTPLHNSSAPPTLNVDPDVSLPITTAAAVNRGILKRVSNGNAGRRVSFSRNNEVCSFVQNPRVSTSHSLFPPITVQGNGTSEPPLELLESDVQVLAEGDCEKSFHESMHQQDDPGEDVPLPDRVVLFADEEQQPVERDIVELVKSSDKDRRAQLLSYVSSKEFLQSMTPEERCAFSSQLLANLAGFVQ